MRWGVTLRHRTGEGAQWTLKLPDSAGGTDDGLALVRREVTFDAPAGPVPAAAAAVVVSYLRSAPLVVAAQLRTDAPVST